jgi:hypothetical protein
MRQFQNMVEAYNTRISRQYEHTRAICYYIAAANRDPKKPFPQTMQKFWPLPTDGHTERVIDADRKKKILELYDKAKEWHSNTK